jgi:uncharacterized protein YgiM (DUF1202 family)
MKRFATILVLSAAIAASPAMAGDRENIGGAIGATVGAFVGSNVGHGTARLATTAAGAVGGFIIGQNIAHNDRDRYQWTHTYHDPRRRSYGHAIEIRPINGIFEARTTSNVRTGPSTRYGITDRLYRRQHVKVIGKVEGRSWFVVETHHRRGFVYAPLLRPDHDWRRDDHDWDNRRHDRDRYGWMH